MCHLDQKKLVQTKAPALVLRMSYFCRHHLDWQVVHDMLKTITQGLKRCYSCVVSTWEKWAAPVFTCCRRLLAGRGASGPFEEALLCTRNGRLQRDRLVRWQVTVDVNDNASTMVLRASVHEGLARRRRGSSRARNLSYSKDSPCSSRASASAADKLVTLAFLQLPRVDTHNLWFADKIFNVMCVRVKAFCQVSHKP